MMVRDLIRVKIIKTNTHICGCFFYELFSSKEKRRKQLLYLKQTHNFLIHEKKLS